MKAPLINKEDINTYARPCYADDDLALHCIEEAEMLDLKPILGDKLYMRLKKDGIPQLMDGGEWGDGEYYFSGLKKALCYYAYARIVRAGNAVQTRFGFVEKRDDYSEGSDLKSRIAAYNEAFAIADGYMKEVIFFIEKNKGDYLEYKGQKETLKNGRVTFKKIGK